MGSPPGLIFFPPRQPQHLLEMRGPILVAPTRLEQTEIFLSQRFGAPQQEPVYYSIAADSGTPSVVAVTEGSEIRDVDIRYGVPQWGDLVVEMDLETPTGLSPEQRQLLQEFLKLQGQPEGQRLKERVGRE